MASTTHPSKEQVRQFMEQRRAEHTPPPAPGDIRRQLGWEMLRDTDAGNYDRQRYGTV